MQGLWLASGKENTLFEEEYARYTGVPYAICVNSGSAANLIALQALDLPKGSKVLTSGCGFPATLSPILHSGFEPVLVDYDRDTLNIDVPQTVDAIQNKGVKAAIFAHTMGVPVDMDPIMAAAEKHGVRIIEDCCEAAGAKYGGKPVGGIGDVGTFSFYPSHQITALGGGGMLTMKDKATYRRAKSLRDWGKSPDWDGYGQQNTVYDTMVDGLPYFRHYSYSTVGFNAKLPEANAAFGREQLKKLDEFCQARAVNHARLKEKITLPHAEHIVPEKSTPGWFGYVITLPEGQSRNRLGYWLESNGIRHRPFFAGNITRHPPFILLRRHFPVADLLMRQTLFVGVHPGLSQDDMDYIAEKVNSWQPE